MKKRKPKPKPKLADRIAAELRENSCMKQTALSTGGRAYYNDAIWINTAIRIVRRHCGARR